MTDTDHAKLYGRSAEEGIVDVAMVMRGDPVDVATLKSTGESEPSPCVMKVWTRTEDGEVESYSEKHRPYLLLKDPSHLRGFRAPCELQDLRGGLAYSHVLFVETWGDMWKAKSTIERNAGGTMNPCYMITDPAKQYLMRTGKTLFGGMKPEDVKVLSFDIEAYSLEGFPQADNPDHDVFIISMATRDEEWLLHTGPKGMGHALPNEKVLLEQFVKAVQTIDPDVLAGHNFLGFDLPYLRDRCEMYGIYFAIGRGGTVPDTYTSGQRFAERDVEFEAFRVDGRHVADTYLKSLAFDVFSRDMPGYGLKTVAKYFGFADEDRTYVEGDQIARVWDEDPERILRYAMDDARESLRIYDHLTGSDFYTTQILPMRFGDVASSGPAKKIESLMAREYLRQGHSIPEPSMGEMEVGGYTDIFYTGVLGPIIYADVESMYPSIMDANEISPQEKDPLDLFLHLLRRLTDMRFEAKGNMKEMKRKVKQLNEGTEEHKITMEKASELDGRQSSYKILINCFTPGHDTLTRSGFKKIKDLEVGDEVYSIDPETEKVSFKRVVRCYAQEIYEGEIVKVKQGHADLEVTPNHRMFMQKTNPNKKDDPYEWIEAKDMFKSKHRFRFPKGKTAVGEVERTSVSLKNECDRLNIDYEYDPKADRIKYPKQQANWRPNTYRMVDWLNLCGWYVSEGSVSEAKRKDYGYTVRGASMRVNIANKTNVERDEIRELLNEMGINHSESGSGFTFGGRIIGNVLGKDFGVGSHNKKIPAWVWRLNGEITKNLLEKAYLGDGNKSGYRYNTASRQLAEDFVQLSFHCGYRAWIASKDSGCWRVAFYDRSSGVRPSIKSNYRQKIDYEGEILCVEVEDNHTLLAGKNGNLNWVGQSFFGSLGYKRFLWNNFAEADKVTKEGQRLMKKIVEEIEKDGGKVIEVDTDGCMAVPPEGIETGPGATADVEYVDSLTERLPEGIRVGFDGRSEAIVSYKKKNYAIREYGGKIKVKGSSFKARSGISFKLTLLPALLEALSRKSVKEMNAAYVEVRDKLLRREADTDDFSLTKTLKDVEEYKEKVPVGGRNKDAAYELAIQKEKNGGPEAKSGDRITYYVAGGEGRVYERAKLLSEYAGDEDQAYYLDHLEKTAEKFADFFSPADFDAVFPSGGGGLFAKDLSEVEVLNRKVEKEEIVDTPF